MKKFIFALALVLIVFIVATNQADKIVTDAYADNVKCEDGYTCYWAHHVDKPYQKEQCRHNENDQWKFNQPLEECGNDKTKDPTTTSVPPVVVLPTATNQQQIPPTNEPIPEVPTNVPPPNDGQLPTATQSNPDSSTNDRNKNNPTPTLTPTYVTGESPNQICNWCDLAERDTAAQETQAAAQATIAAELTGGD